MENTVDVTVEAQGLRLIACVDFGLFEVFTKSLYFRSPRASAKALWPEFNFE